MSVYTPEAYCTVIFYAVCICLQHVVECEQVIRDLQMNQVSLSDRLAQKKQKLIELHSTSHILDADILSLQDTKVMVRNTYCTVFCITTH